MSIGIYQSASSLRALERWQDAITQNITSSQVVGFKRRSVEVSAIAAGGVQSAGDARVERGEGRPGLFPRVNYSINYEPGEVQTTRRDLDVAIQGPGFFQVDRGDGAFAYTRAGELRMLADRSLVTSANHQVLKTDGRPVELLANGQPLVIEQDGTLRQGETTLGKLAVVNFPDPNVLNPLSAGVFVAPAGVDPQPLAQPTVLQGYLEASNVSSFREMVDLVTISRAYEANQRVIQSRDQSQQKALEALG
jgi:flagellar basal-body rod protein FlgF